MGDDRDDSRVHGTDDVHAKMGHEELLALCEALDLRVHRGVATLEDFGELARARRELARRAQAHRSTG